ncbi:glycine zipper 2TM domain-containing protein [Parasphingopyxis sp. CP4]|uniref:glycine zipper 2TM domain-containing protein n=1 Tax=Parasphingopyxis sp. CP4 TaxID=2724527 RepID=UPI002103CEDE|nr:glycine zipper 2TM domain-containing protein [Parasphingopyxis sp. CP4]
MSLKSFTLTASAALAGAMLIPTAAQAGDGYDRDGYYESRYDDRYDRRDRRRDYRRDYRRGDYYEGRGYRRGDYYSNGYDRRRYRDRRYYRGRCRDNGTGGTVIGGIAGALLGREIARDRGRYGRRGDGTAGAIIGGVAGALAGRAIDRDC